MATHSNSEMRRRVFGRAAERPFFLASALAAYQELCGFDEDGLAAFLGCTSEALTPLGLCRRPVSTAPNFRAAVEQIAAYTGTSSFALARLLRDVDALQTLRRAADRGAPEHGTLLAARDREPGSTPDSAPESEPGSEEDG